MKLSSRARTADRGANCEALDGDRAVTFNNSTEGGKGEASVIESAEVDLENHGCSTVYVRERTILPQRLENRCKNRLKRGGTQK